VAEQKDRRRSFNIRKSPARGEILDNDLARAVKTFTKDNPLLAVFLHVD
jgi:hypothetical protein